MIILMATKQTGVTLHVFLIVWNAIFHFQIWNMFSSDSSNIWLAKPRIFVLRLAKKTEEEEGTTPD